MEYIMELPGHHVCGGRDGPAWAVPARPTPPDTSTAVVNPTIPRFRIFLVFIVFPFVLAASRTAHRISVRWRGFAGLDDLLILYVPVDIAGVATDPNIGARAVIENGYSRA
ncbi:hypothetical protein A5662_01620 [Mycobacteriaceae bacterium 1482268.1]|nr:hypothetical protein A5662_01620 [Mycobacteriaceae bacterium 1482268.1]